MDTRQESYKACYEVVDLEERGRDTKQTALARSVIGQFPIDLAQCCPAAPLGLCATEATRAHFWLYHSTTAVRDSAGGVAKIDKTVSYKTTHGL